MAPAYISVEMDHGDDLIAEMVRLGYQDFKVISQRTLSPASPQLASVVYSLPGKVKHVVRRVDQKLRGRRHDGAWTFPSGSSGAFAERTPGRWLPANPAREVCAALDRLDEQHHGKGLEDWFDIHARHPDQPAFPAL